MSRIVRNRQCKSASTRKVGGAPSTRYNGSASGFLERRPATCPVAGTRPWPLLGLVNACFAVEVALGWRRSIPATIQNVISEATGSRAMLQLATLVLVIAAGLFLLGKLRRPATDGANSGAVTATLLTASLFLVDTA